MNVFSITEPGTRNYNEDSLYFAEQNGRSLFVVADGLGGHGKGEIASAMCVETFKKNFGVIPDNVFIPKTLQETQNNILARQQAENCPNEMKTTCVALLISGGIVRYGHIGDTRGYIFHKNKLKERTFDHSVPQMLVLSKEIKEKHIRKHPDRNRLLRVLGTPWDTPKYELSEDISLQNTSAFLLCTDGFWELCVEKKMCGFLKKSGGNAQKWLMDMKAEVEKNGYGTDMDNFTAIAVIR